MRPAAVRSSGPGESVATRKADSGARLAGAAAPAQASGLLHHAAFQLRAARILWLPDGGPGVVHPIYKLSKIVAHLDSDELFLSQPETPCDTLCRRPSIEYRSCMQH